MESIWKPRAMCVSGDRHQLGVNQQAHAFLKKKKKRKKPLKKWKQPLWNSLRNSEKYKENPTNSVNHTPFPWRAVLKPPALTSTPLALFTVPESPSSHPMVSLSQAAVWLTLDHPRENEQGCLINFTISHLFFLDHSSSLELWISKKMPQAPT